MADPLRLGLVGCGSWGKLILRDLGTLGAHTWVVARSEATRANARAGQAQGIVAHAEQLPDGLDGFVVATPLPDHAASIRLLLPRRRPIFVEKPMTDDPAAAAAIAGEAGDRVFVMDKWRYHPGIHALAAMVADRRFGSLLALHCIRVGWGHSHLQTDAVWTLLPHDMSICLHLLGSLPVPLAASAERDALGRVTGLAVFAKHHGTPVTLQVSSASPARRREIRASFADATVVLPDALSDHLLVQPGHGGDAQAAPPSLLPIPVEMPLLSELRAFLAHLRGGPPPLSSATDGAATVAAVAACRNLAGC